MSQPNDQLAREFAKYLSRHGFGFQYAVIKHIRLNTSAPESGLNHPYPVNLNGYHSSRSMLTTQVGWLSSCTISTRRTL